MLVTTKTLTATMYSTDEVAARTGLSYRMIDYWIRSRPDVFAPAQSARGSGSQRRFSETDVLRFGKAADLVRWLNEVNESPFAHSMRMIAAFAEHAEMVSGDDGPMWCWESPSGELCVKAS